MYLIASLENFQLIKYPFWNKLALFAVTALCMTVIEYIAGIICLKVAKVRLWDYTNEWGNIQGIICPKFSLIWAILGAVYYYLIHPRICKRARLAVSKPCFFFCCRSVFRSIYNRRSKFHTVSCKTTRNTLRKIRLLFAMRQSKRISAMV